MPSKDTENTPDIFVSIIVPVKNEERYLSACMSALTTVDYPKHLYEIIVVDNGSVDRSVEIAKECGAKIFIKPDINISALRNFGAKAANGTVLAFIDADVIVDKQWLKNAIKHFAGNRSEVVCTGSNPGIPLDATWVTKARHLMVEAKEKTEVNRKWLTSMNLIIRKDILNEIGGFNESLITCEDVDLGYRLTRKYKILYDKEIKAIHLGEPLTIAELFKKEIWRGTSNFQGLSSHGLVLHEIPSLLLPVYHFMILLLLAAALLSGAFHVIGLLVILLLIPAVLKTLIVVNKTKQYNMLLKFFVCYFSYILARTLPIVFFLSGKKITRSSVSHKKSRL